MYVFLNDFDSGTGEKLELYIYCGQLEGDDGDMGYEIESRLSGFDSAPDNLFFIFPSFLMDSFSSFISKKDVFYRNIIRYGDRTKLYFFSFNEKAILTQEFSYEFDGPYTNGLDELRSRAIKNGIFNLIDRRRDQVIQKSPPGTVFLKPSNKEFSEFIKSSELCVHYSEVQFLAFCVLEKFPSSVSVDSIWIDTFGISSIVERVIYYLAAFSSSFENTLCYRSFNSYEGLVDHKPSYVDDCWVIISASTSNNLGRKIISQWGVKQEQVVTILSYIDYDEELQAGNVVANIRQFSSEPHGSYGAIGIKIEGENFVPKYKEPISVIIKKSHSPKAVKELIYPLKEGGIVCNSVTPSGSKKDVFFDFEKILSSDFGEKVESWISKMVLWAFSANLGAVVYDRRCSYSVCLVSLMQRILGASDVFCEVLFVDVTCLEEVPKDKNIVVIAAVVSSGKSFVRLNRDFRLMRHSGNRLFMSPFVTANSKQEFSKVKNSLVVGPNGLKYSILTKNTVYTGQSIKNSWECELDVIAGFDGDFWQWRINFLSNAKGFVEHIGLPAAPNMEPLKFTDGFAFWGDYNAEEIDQSAVYATVCSILQQLRDNPIGDPFIDSLESSIYQLSVIDAENFVRFDDPLLHSCLWRASHGAEMDYSGAPELTESFTAFFSRLIKRYAAGESNAALDIWMGLATRRIRLAKNVLDELYRLSVEVLQDNTDAMQLLDYIGVELLGRESEAKLF